jgi:hypothetical protein
MVTAVTVLLPTSPTTNHSNIKVLSKSMMVVVVGVVNAVVNVVLSVKVVQYHDGDNITYLLYWTNLFRDEAIIHEPTVYATMIEQLMLINTTKNVDICIFVISARLPKNGERKSSHE